MPSKAWLLYLVLPTLVLPTCEALIGSDGDATSESAASIQTNSGIHICSGVVIGTDLILTAASCVANQPPEKFQVQVGSAVLGKGTTANVKAIVVHEDYVSPGFGDDIAVMKLATSTDVKVADLETSANDYTTGNAGVVGWGMDESFKTTEILKGATLELRPVEDCSKSLFRVVSSSVQICTGPGSTSPKSICQGDAGGALTNDDTGVTIGIASFSDPMCRSHSVFTKVGVYSNWIENVRKELEAETFTQSLDGPCVCTTDTTFDVGGVCAKWLNAPHSWCYTDSSTCATAIESVRYEGKYWTGCVPSLADSIIDSAADATPDPSLAADENYEDADFVGIESAVRKRREERIQRYIIAACVTTGVGALVVAAAIIIARKRREGKLRKEDTSNTQLSGAMSPKGVAPIGELNPKAKTVMI